MKKILFFILFYASTGSIAQLKNISFDHLMVENGMPENFAIDICQDNSGYIWCGTQKGIMRYDGYKIKVYKYEVAGNDNAINAIGTVFVDKEGVVWAGSVGNYLLRYSVDADTFMIYKPDTAVSGTFSQIVRITDDGINNLWLKIDNPANPAYPLQRFDKKTGKFFPAKMSSKGNADIQSDHLIDFLSDKAGRIWIGTENGIYTYNDEAKKFDVYLASTDPSVKRVLHNLFEAPSEPGIIYMSVVLVNGESGTPKGMARYDIGKNKATFYSQDASNPNSFPGNATSCFYEDRKKRLWIGTNNSLIYFDREKNSFQSFSPGIEKPVSFDMIKEDKDGDFWIIGENPGQALTSFSPETKLFNRYFAEPDKADGLASDNIVQVFADKAGNIWLAFRSFGIERINRVRSRFTSFTFNPKDPTGYPGGITRSIAQSKDGLYWLATSQGLVKYDPEKGFSKIKLFKEPALANAGASYILADKDGFLWFRYQSKGLIRYDPKSGSVLNFRHDDNDSNSISHDFISCLYEDRNGVLWVGTDGGGLCRYNKGKGNFNCFPFINNSKVKYTGTALDDAAVSSIHEDEQGRLWISTNLGGINLMNREKGTFTSFFNESEGLANIVGIEDADSGRLWLSTYFQGLTLFDPAKGTSIKTFKEKNGLLSDILTWLKKDKEGNLWIGSARGLSRLDLKSNEITNYTNLQGLPSNVLFQPLIDEKGEIFIGSKLGFFKFFPKDMSPSLVTPVTNLESVSFPDARLHNQSDTMVVSGRKQINLEYNQNKITFHYTGIQFENSLLNTYMYKLVGYDDDWIMAGDSRNAVYTNLSPGTYTFYVKSANMDGVWNDTPASLIVKIYPPWWQTWWAYTLYFLAFILVLWAFVRWRLIALNKEKAVLEDKVETRTKELQQSLNNLKATQSQLIQSEKMASLGVLTAGIAHEIQNPLNFVNNFSDVNAELVEEAKIEMGKGNIAQANEILNSVKENEQKINHHGKRADAIVKGMLEHSRTGASDKEPVDLNALVDEYVRLCYHARLNDVVGQGLRSKDKNFNVSIHQEFDHTVGKVNLIPKDIARVLLNVVANAFYAVNEKKKSGPDNYEPTVTVGTRRAGEFVEITVKDNGIGIPDKILDKIFQPFYTTKPAGQGTGLGLSLSYDIVKAHGGNIRVTSVEGEGSEFIVELSV